MTKLTHYFGLIVALLLICGCSEEVDTSARYVFKYDTVLSYLQKHEAYSEYAGLLRKVNIGKYSSSKVGELLSARGNYTVFAPSNQAIHDYLETLVDEGLISEPSWDAFAISISSSTSSFICSMKYFFILVSS